MKTSVLVYAIWLIMIVVFTGCELKRDQEPLPQQPVENEVNPEVGHWNKTDETNTINAFESFLKEYPYGDMADKAKERLENLYWKNAKDSNSIEAYEMFVKQYPNSSAAQKARYRFARLYWKEVIEADSFDSYKGFIDKTTFCEHTIKAHRKLGKLLKKHEKEMIKSVQKQNSLEGYISYLAFYPKGQIAEDARKFLLDKMSDDVKVEVEKLMSENPVDMGNAAYALRKLGDSAYPSIPFLVDIFGDETELEWVDEYGTRKFFSSNTSPGELAAIAIAKMSHRGKWHLFITLKNEDPEFRAKAAFSLGLTKRAYALGPLLEALDDEDHEVRISVATALGELGNGLAEKPLTTSLSDPVEQVRVAAIKALCELKTVSTLEPLTAILKKDKSSQVKIAAMLGLKKTGDKQVVESILLLLSGDKDSEVRCAAAEVLGDMADQGAVEHLIKALRDKDEMVRDRAVRSLGQIKSISAVEPIITCLDNGAVTDTVAIYALGEIGDTRAARVLRDILKSEIAENNVNLDKMAHIARILGEFKQTSAVEVLVGTLEYFEKCADEYKYYDETNDQEYPTPEYIESLREIKFALKKITGQTFGSDYKKWKIWCDQRKINPKNEK